jgi:uncharacterized membrane protein YhhN
MYVAAFIYLTGFSGWLSWAALGVIGVSLGAFIWLRQHLGRMTAPVIAYIVVISIMVIGAWAVFTDPEIPRRGGFFVFAGALLFYLSDLFVARDRFVAPGFFNRRVGLPMYYAGQFLLAFSVGRIG